MKYFPLLIFIFSIVLIVYLQFNSGASIQNLIQSNASLLSELKAKSALQKLQIEIISVESNIRGAVITGRLDHLKNVEQRIRDIRSDVRQISHAFSDPVSDSILSLLNVFVEKKIGHSYSVLNTFYKYGKDSAEGIINTNRGKVLTDTILQLIDHFDSTRQDNIQAITSRIASDGNKAMNRGMVMALIAAISSMGAFWYIIIITRRQQKLINILDVSEKKEREASKIKEQFLANMSHEIRTPMNAMMGFTSLLQQTQMDALQQEYVQHLQSSGSHLLSIVNDILDLSKMEAGMMKIEKETFDFHELVYSLEPMFREKANEKNIQLIFDVDENIPRFLSSDAVRLKQVLVNLLSNAIKFTPAGRVAVAVAIAGKKDETLQLRFTITDSGIGMTEDEIKIIFDRFQQAEPSTTRRFGGTGLGLSIVQQLVKLLQGSLVVSSEKNKGSIFTLELPFQIVSSNPSTKAFMGDHFEKLLNHTHNDLKILVAEDNPMNQALLKFLLTKKKIDFAIVNNGKEVLEALQHHKYDLLLMDMQMPEMDGYTAIERIRHLYGNDLPVIAMTANAMPGEREKCLRLGMNDYISKPIDEGVLFAMIRKYSSAPCNHETQIIDKHFLKELSNGDVEFERNIISQFLEQVPQELAALQKAIDKMDTPIIKSVAHNLKSTVGYIGMSADTTALLEHIELGAGKATSFELMRLFEAVESNCNRAIIEIGGQ